MFWKKWFNRQQKLSEAHRLIGMNSGGKPQGTPHNYAGFSKEAYGKNVVAFKCVNQTAQAVAKIDWVLKNKRSGEEITSHPLLDLLARPNPMQGKAQFFEAMISYFRITGNSYVNAVSPGSSRIPLELWCLRPDRMTVVAGQSGVPSAYKYKIGQTEYSFKVDEVAGKSPILHLKSFNPTNDWYGMSPIEATMYNIDMHNESGKWNFSLLRNGANPSLILQVKGSDGNPGGVLPTEVFNRLKDEISHQYSGASNAAKIMLLEGNIEAMPVSFSPHEMDWIQSRATSARDIATAFGIPPLMLNIANDNTFANYKEARVAFYEDTVIPLAQWLRDELNNWLTPAYGEELALDIDLDSIDALAEKRESKFMSIKDAAFLTVNEKRAALGYDQVDGLDVFLLPNGLLPVPKDEAADLLSSDIGIDPQPSEDPAQGEDDQPADEGNPDDEAGDNQVENIDDGTQDEGAKANGIHEVKRIRFFNLVNSAEKLAAQRAQLRIRDHFEGEMYGNIKTALIKQGNAIAEALIDEPNSGNWVPLLEQAFTASMIGVEKAYKKAYKTIISWVSNWVFQKAKDDLGIRETKDEQDYFDQWADSWIDRKVGERISYVRQTGLKKAKRMVKDIMKDATENELSHHDIKKAIQAKFEGANSAFGAVSEARARTIARTESGIVTQTALIETAKSLEVDGLFKEWVSHQDDRTRSDPSVADHYSMNGVRVDLNEKFIVPPDAEMDGPNDSAASPEQVINCRCTLVFGQGKK